MSLRKRKPHVLSRKIQTRESYDSVLIVCEGKKTEPYYIDELRKYFQLSQANVVIDPNSDSSPISVVEYALKLAKEAIKQKNPYTRVYCVMDRDRHHTFTQAMSKIAGYNSTVTTADTIISIPCFEYWILMHYEATTSIFGASGGSPCDDLIRTKLKNYIPSYSKADRTKSKELIETKLDTAIKNSKTTTKVAKSSGTNNPSTQMHELVEYLKNLKA